MNAAALEMHRSGIVCVLLDPELEGADQVASAAFGRHGVRHLAAMRKAMPGGWVAMVGRVRRDPARVVACRPGAAGAGVDAAIAMARRLASSSTWAVHLAPQHQAAVLALLAERTECQGGLQ